ncbi:MAG: hypothetical protein ABL966_03300 [Acidimicrobiales bacterium]
MAGGDLVRMVPVLTGADLVPMVAFWRRLGFEVTADFAGAYIILATDPSDEAAVEVHLSRWDDHDQRTAGAVYLRVRDAAALHERIRAQLEAEGLLYLAPGDGLTAALTVEVRAMEDAGTPFVRLHELVVQDYGQIEFAVIDPAGWLVRVGSPAP